MLTLEDAYEAIFDTPIPSGNASDGASPEASEADVPTVTVSAIVPPVGPRWDIEYPPTMHFY